jgi:hypothetical protein
MRYGILFLFCIICILHEGMTYTNQKAAAKMDTILINKRKFGDDGNRSFFTNTINLQGKIVWPDNPAALGKTCNSTPLHLALYNNRLIVDCGSQLNVLDKNTGIVEVNKAKFNNAEFYLNEKGIVTVNHAGYYEILDLKGGIVESVLLPECVDNARLFFFTMFQNDGYYCVNYFGSKFVSPQKNPAPVNFSFVHMKMDKQVCVWSYVKREELSKWICRPSDGSNTYIASDKNLYIISKNADQNEPVKIMPFISIEGLSLLHNDELLIIEKTEKSRFLHQVNSITGKKFSIEIPQNGEIIQPAASSPDGIIYLAIGSSLYCFKNGNELWQHHFEALSQPILISVLSDNSVLSVSGHFISQTQPDGKVTFEKFLIPEISCRPVIDSEGHAYIGGNGGIVCLQ